AIKGRRSSQPCACGITDIIAQKQNLSGVGASHLQGAGALQEQPSSGATAVRSTTGATACQDRTAAQTGIASQDQAATLGDKNCPAQGAAAATACGTCIATADTAAARQRAGTTTGTETAIAAC